MWDSGPHLKVRTSLFYRLKCICFTIMGTFYGEEVDVDWYIRLRGEQKFNGMDELSAQIEKDKQAAIRFFDRKRLDEQL